MELIHREEWGAIPNKYPFKHHKPSKITIHNIGSSESPIIPDFKGHESIQSIDRYHVKTKGWNAIGYHFIIGTEGEIYEGRPETVVGAHVKNDNTNNIGINIYCNSNVEVPTDAQIKSLKDLLIYLTNKYNINDKRIYGHNQLGNTDCPGSNLKRILPVIFDTFREDEQLRGETVEAVVMDEVSYVKVDVLSMMKEISEDMNKINHKMVEIAKLLK